MITHIFLSPKHISTCIFSENLFSNMLTHALFSPKFRSTWITSFQKKIFKHDHTHTFISPKCFNMWIIYFFQNKIFKHAHPHLLFSKMYMHMDHIFAKENNQTCWLTLLFLQNVLAHVWHSFHKQWNMLNPTLFSPKCRSRWITIIKRIEDCTTTCAQKSSGTVIL